MGSMPGGSMTETQFLGTQMGWVFGILGLVAFVLIIDNVIRPKDEVPQKPAKRNGKMAGSGNPEEKVMKKIATILVALVAITMSTVVAQASWDKTGAVFAAIPVAEIEQYRSPQTEETRACVSTPVWYKNEGERQFYKMNMARKNTCSDPINQIKTLWYTENGAAVVCKYHINGTLHCLVENLQARPENMVINSVNTGLENVNNNISHIASTQQYMVQRDVAIAACKARVLDSNNKARGCMQTIDMAKTVLVYAKKGEYDIRQDRLYEAASNIAGTFACPKVIDMYYCEADPTLLLAKQ